MLTFKSVYTAVCGFYYPLKVFAWRYIFITVGGSSTSSKTSKKPISVALLYFNVNVLSGDATLFCLALNVTSVRVMRRQYKME